MSIAHRILEEIVRGCTLGNNLSHKMRPTRGPIFLSQRSLYNGLDVWRELKHVQNQGCLKVSS
jgi:hypothetical protein